jgi:hypothetical protein
MRKIIPNLKEKHKTGRETEGTRKREGKHFLPLYYVFFSTTGRAFFTIKN